MTAGLAIRAAFVSACRLDVAVRKPGNVSLASPGHGMTAGQFVASAEAAAPALCAPGATIGQRIEAAVDASWQAAGCNTNLGIVLLCAPLAAAAEGLVLPAAPEHLRSAVGRMLAGLTVADAECAFRAIARANPGGLGRPAEHDVREPARVTLREAMALAAGRDSIARQYRDGFADLFDTGLAAAANGHAAAHKTMDEAHTAAAVQRVYLAWLAGWPDSHIVRKHGLALAHSVIGAAQPWWQRAQRGEAVGDDPAFAEWDHQLKHSAVNPGTCADLTVATLMLAALAGARWHGS